MDLTIKVYPISTSVAVVGKVADFTPGEISATLDLFLPIGTPVAASLHDSSFNGEILCSTAENGFYKTNIRIKDADENGLRSVRRFSVHLPAHVFTHDGCEPHRATIVDISGSGLGLLVPVPLSTGDGIAVDSEMNMALGTVRYCRKSSKGFRVGVQLHHVFEKNNAVRNKTHQHVLVNGAASVLVCLKTFVRRCEAALRPGKAYPQNPN